MQIVGYELACEPEETYLLHYFYRHGRPQRRRQHWKDDKMANQLRERCIDAEIIKENHKKDSGRNPAKKLYLKLYYHVKHELCVGKSSQKP